MSSGDQWSPDGWEMDALKKRVKELEEKRFSCIFCGGICSDVKALKEHSVICASHPAVQERDRLLVGTKEHARQLDDLEEENSLLSLKRAAVSEELKIAYRNNRSLQRQLNAVHTPSEGVWKWQGRGWEEYAENDVSTLSVDCPVVMMPEVLVKLKSAYDHLQSYRAADAAQLAREGMLLHEQFKRWKHKHLNDEVKDAVEVMKDRAAALVREHEYSSMVSTPPRTIGDLLDQMADEILGLQW